MKKLILITMVFTLAVGCAMADPGIPKVNEVQGLSTSTTVVAAGNFNSAGSVDVTISHVEPITAIPGTSWDGDDADEEIYQSVYTEDTQNSEVGYISYDKDLDVSTANKVSGQYNIQAVKQVTYLGVDASSIVTNDFLMVDGAGWGGDAGSRMICPFASDSKVAYPAFCNRIETGSTMNLKVANVNTQLGDRFIMKSADPGVAMYDNVGVSSYAADLPSKGSVSAYIKGSIKEGGRMSDVNGVGSSIATDSWSVQELYETVTFSDSTAVSGDISTFAKGMSYNSVIDTSGDYLLFS